MNPKTKKARNTILYICKKMQDARGFGSIVLNKALYYTDHVNYLETGDTITGFGYVKQVHGPTPDPAEFLKLRTEMLKNKEIREKQFATRFGGIQKRMIAQVAPDMSVFSPNEVALMDEVLELLMDTNAKAISDYSHESLAWKMAEHMEALPRFTFFLTESELTQSDLTWGDRTIASHKAA